ncbi:hypothetical protein [Salmonella enterica]|uniref:hypothetical protein n=1 Tax=Salmonella enterica TaxID=28901 RepID=UPI0009B0451D|nr:hypothetical protein [Salmonella enterica]
MYETTYPIDTAAEILGCQQKKILTEWAKGTINIVLDFGDPDALNKDCYDKYDSRSYQRITPWNSANITAPATAEYFPAELLSPRKTIFDTDYYESTFHEYLNSGFYFNGDHCKIEQMEGTPGSQSIIQASNVLLYGLWVVPYSEFARLHVQESFALRVCSPRAILAAVTATFTPGIGSRRINAPEKKNLRITESDMAVMRKLLSGRPGHQQAQPPAEEPQEHAKTHGGVERFALEREKILAAALYVAHHFPKEKGKSFKSHAECISKHAYLFWKGGPEGDTPPDPERIAKILSDATRTPDEWKILGGNAKSKR